MSVELTVNLPAYSKESKESGKRKEKPPGEDIKMTKVLVLQLL